MVTKFRKSFLGIGAALMLAVVGCDGEQTPTATVAAEANASCVADSAVEFSQCEDATLYLFPALAAEVKSFAEGLAGDADLQKLWTSGTNIVARIEAVEDINEFCRQINAMQDAILGIRFREGPMADSYYDWCWSIDIFDHMGNQCVKAMWRRTQELPWICDFRLKQMAILKHEIERIADAKPKPDPPNFDGVHPTLDMVQSTLKTCLKRAYERTFHSRAFREYYDSLSPMEKGEWRDRLESRGQHFK